MSMESSSTSSSFNPDPILNYLGLPLDYEPSLTESPVNFLSKYLRLLPPNLLALFSALLTPQQRTILPIIRNRRQKYASTYPRELSIGEARKRWPLLWPGRDRPGIDQGKEEKLWADSEFLGGQQGQQVGRLGGLLATYEEEREAERVREAKRGDLESRMAVHSLNDESEEDDDEREDLTPEEYETPQQIEVNFERLIRERFIYGLLDVGDAPLHCRPC